MSHPPFVRWPPIRRHVLDPRRRKSSIISRPLEAGFSCSHWSIFSMTTSKPPWRSTVSCPRNPRALPGRLPFPGPWHARTPRNASCTDFRLRDRRSLHLHRSRAARRRAVRGGDSRGRRRTAKCRGASLPNVIHWGWRGAPAPSNPDRGALSPGPPSPPPLPSPSPMTEASMAPEATATGGMRRFGEAFDHNGEGGAL